MDKQQYNHILEVALEQIQAMPTLLDYHDITYDEVQSIIESINKCSNLEQRMNMFLNKNLPQVKLNVPHSNPNGITIKELKQILFGWPENDVYEPHTIWFGKDGLSNPVTTVTRLNENDLIFECKNG